MGALNDLFRNHAPEYRRRFEAAMPRHHTNVLDAIVRCRTEDNGTVLLECAQCGDVHPLPRSCGNRHCPGCQGKKAFEWLERQTARQVPGHHFLLTFTVPERLRRFIRAHQRVGYEALFQASSGAIKKLIRDPKHVGGVLPGFFGVLHTWTRQLEYHPHVHYVAAGGALSTRDQRWHPAAPGFFVPVRALSRIFRAKFRHHLARANLLGLAPKDVWNDDWVVHCQAIPSAEVAAGYLAPYLFRVAISDHRIVKVEHDTVHFRYRKNHSNRPRVLALPTMEFLRRFLQHVLPRGFMKVRYYGFLNPTARVSLDYVRAQIELAHAFLIETPATHTKQSAPMACRACGGPLRYRSTIGPTRHRDLRPPPPKPALKPPPQASPA